MAMIRKTLDEVKREAGARAADKPAKPNPEEIRKAAEADPDTWLPTEEELKRFKTHRERAKPKTKEMSEDGRDYDDND